MSIIRKILSGFIAVASAYMLYHTYDTVEAHAWVLAMSGWAIIFLGEFNEPS